VVHLESVSRTFRLSDKAVIPPAALRAPMRISMTRRPFFSLPVSEQEAVAVQCGDATQVRVQHA